MSFFYSETVENKLGEIQRVLSVFDFDHPQQVGRKDVSGLVEMAETYECRVEFIEYMLANKLRFRVRDEFLNQSIVNKEQ